KNSLCQINSDNLFHGTPLHIAVGLHLQHGSLKSLWGGVHFIRSEYCYIFAMPCPLPGKGNNKMAQNGDTHNSWQVSLTLSRLEWSL
ncbi:hypothetical protein, partial [Shewanella algae]|uniref:hypothetical protein n=1 Tax=Shewanella algae TaxID=38313 RepID=UPI0031F5BE27